MLKPNITKQELQSCSPFISGVQIRARKLHRELLGLKQQTTRKLDLKICAGRRIDNARKESPQKKRPRDFDKSKVPVSVELPSPLQTSEKLNEEDMQLNFDQAIGRILSAKANFMRVVVLKPGCQSSTSEESLASEGTPNNNRMALVEKTEITVDDKGLTNPGPLDAKEKLGRELLCVVRALLKKIKRRVMVGDKVLVSGIDWVDGRGMIEEVFDRETEIFDPPVANVDQLLVLAALDRPRPEPLSLSRFLVEAESTGIPFTVVFNKTDLVSSKDVSDWESRLSSWGYKPLFCSAASKLGISPLVDILANKTSAIIGLSGVGKSSVINALCDEAGLELWNSSCEEDPVNVVKDESVWSGVYEEQTVGEVSERTGRGKHTTRHVSLLKLPSAGYLVDTPGFNQPNLARVSTKSLPLLFPEIKSKLNEATCAFGDCLHVGEPDCAVGGDWDRYEHYLQLLEEVKKRGQLEMKTFGTKRESEMRYKVGALGVKQAEPRLVLKKHRRVSRKKGKEDLAVELAEEVDSVSPGEG
ncbi:hypothetical protein GOP47_0022736 [Adiantum capillus-veneris]|uniref:Uncharacterized protein n=1 Tax=Adiantum capillus-veneris TaxID=13818 RepID=A0A9D4Z6A4_ADICA|nr:hypothetical protein GOP47_0022736 [Adiantum capillus-veneris]